MASQPMILNTDDAAAKRVTVTGWVSRDGHFYGDDERTARWAGATHVACEACGQPVCKTWLKCEPCRAKAEAERWAAMPLVEWDGKTPFCLHDSDRFFFDADSFYDWLADGEDDDGNPLNAADVRLVLCDPVPFQPVRGDYWADDLPDDSEGYLPDPIQRALDALNAAIKALDEPACWRPGKQRIVLPPPPAPEGER